MPLLRTVTRNQKYAIGLLVASCVLIVNNILYSPTYDKERSLHGLFNIARPKVQVVIILYAVTAIM